MRAATSAIPYKELEVATGNYDASRGTITKVIIHTMVGTWQSAAARFATYGAGGGPASAHYGIGMDGNLYHWLEEFFTAYHAGNYVVNQTSIGIEHEDKGAYNAPRPDALYTTSAKLVRDICQYYNIPIDRKHILKHSEVSLAPTGCPDSLDIDRIVREAQAAPAPVPTTCDPKEFVRVQKLLTDNENTNKQKDQWITQIRTLANGNQTEATKVAGIQKILAAIPS